MQRLLGWGVHGGRTHVAQSLQVMCAATWPGATTSVVQRAGFVKQMHQLVLNILDGLDQTAEVADTILIALQVPSTITSSERVIVVCLQEQLKT
eukprot:SAG11_NODE_4198_length_2019_cov_8.222917_1_plen_94_part_00